MHACTHVDANTKCLIINVVCNCIQYDKPQGCQIRDPDSGWSMGAYDAAEFIVDEQGITLRYNSGNDGRCCTLRI